MALTRDQLRRFRWRFAVELSARMGYEQGLGDELAERVVDASSPDYIRVEFRWDGGSVLSQPLTTEPEAAFDGDADLFAMNVAAALKERKARFGESLPWE